MEDIKIGSVVRLKSGGPNMTVRDIRCEGLFIRCQWFSFGLQLTCEEFHRDCLVLANPS